MGIRKLILLTVVSLDRYSLFTRCFQSADSKRIHGGPAYAGSERMPELPQDYIFNFCTYRSFSFYPDCRFKYDCRKFFKRFE